MRSFDQGPFDAYRRLLAARLRAHVHRWSGRCARGRRFTFNAWGNKYRPHDKDAALGERIADLAGFPVYRSTSSWRAAAFCRTVKER